MKDTYKLHGNLLEGAKVVCLHDEKEYENYIENNTNFVFKVIFFKESGKCYTTEYFLIMNAPFSVTNTYKRGYEKLSYALYEAVCCFVEKEYEGYKDMTAVLDFPAFYPTLFTAEQRK